MAKKAKLDINEQIFTLLEDSGLNWEVVKEPLVSSIDSSTTEVYGIFKKTSREYLGVVKGRYTPYQNYQLAEALITASQSLNVNYSNGGELNNGKKVYLQAELPDEFIGKSGVKRHLTALNGHDGLSAIGFGSSNTVVVCQNTFFRAYKDLTKFKHSITAADRVMAMAVDMNAALLADQQLMTNFKRMADTPLRDEMVERVIKKLFTVNLNDKQDDISTKKKNIIGRFAESLDTEIKLEGKTMWGLFNAVTRYTNHVSAPSDPNDKMDYLMTGQGYKLSNLTYELLMQELGDFELV